jgi:anti-sigma factor RsiW
MTVMGSIDIGDEEIHAYIDGELPAARAVEIARLIAAQPALADRIAGFRADKDQLSGLYGPLIDRPLPPDLIEALAGRKNRVQPDRRWMMAAGLAAATLVAAIWFATPLLRNSPTDSLVAEALSARAGGPSAERRLRPEALAALAERDRLIAETLGVAVKSPDLQRAGFTLTGLAIYRAGSGHAVELRYADARGRVFTVYLHAPLGADSFELRERGATRICIWQNSDLSAVMIADMSSSEMLRVASLTYADLTF